jgi:hypothetical protein
VEPEGYDNVEASDESDEQSRANQKAKDIRMLELKRGHGYSRGRMSMMLTHKYGYSEEETAAAIQYITRLGLTGNPKVEADLKQSGVGVTYLHSSLNQLAQLAAFLDALKTATRLMARATPMSKIAERGMHDIVQYLMRDGYVPQTSQNKAFFTTVFYSKDAEEPRFELVGWHGTGRFEGGEKAILEFYDDEKSQSRPVISIGAINDDNLTPAKQQEVIQHIMEYVKTHG